MSAISNKTVAVAAGGGGGGWAASKSNQGGGAGGTEAFGGTGGRGGSNLSSSPGSGGPYGTGLQNAGGAGGHSIGCTGGDTGGAGEVGKGGAGGAAGEWSLSGYIDVGLGLLGYKDCSIPPSSSGLLPSFGGRGGGGGGGYIGGGGGGGGDDSGFGPGGGGASGRSFTPELTHTPGGALGMEITRWRGDPYVDIYPVVTLPAITSADHTTFAFGTPSTFTVTATGVNIPYVSIDGEQSTQGHPGTLAQVGLHNVSAGFADGDGAGSAVLSGTPQKSGVFPLTAKACNLKGCVNQAFSLTVNEAPGFSSPATAVFAAGQQGSFTVATSGWPRPTITKTGAPGWLNLTNNGDGTATLSGTPPATLDSYTFTLTATNGIGSPATQTFVIPIVTALNVTPQNTHLVPGLPVTSVLPGIYAFRRGYTQQFRAIGTNPDGSTFDATDGLRWSSSNPLVADPSTRGLAEGLRPGLVTATQLGTTTITASTASPLSAATNVVVAMPYSIKVTPAIDLIPGQTQQFKAMGCYGDPCSTNSFDITNNVTWSSLNTKVQVTADGFGTAVSGGITFVAAEVYSTATPGHAGGDARVAVTHGKVMSIDLTPSLKTITKFGLATFAATAHYEDGTLDSNTVVSWSAQDVSGTGVAYVGQNVGSTTQVGGQAVGTATIRASFVNPGGPTASATATLKVISVPYALSVTPSSFAAALTKGKTRQYTATAEYVDGSPDVNVTKGVTWTSSNPSVATVSSEGLVTAVGTTDAASSTIAATYTYTNASGGTSQLQRTVTMTIAVMPSVSIAITPTSVPTLHPGDRQQFTATGTYTDGSTLDVTRMVTWATDSAIVQSVSNGLLLIRTGTGQGTVHVTANYRSAVTSNSVEVTVTDPLDHVRVTTDLSYTSTIPAGQVTGGIHVDGYDARNNYLGDFTYASTFSISPDGSCNQDGRYCGANLAGAHTITATTPGAVDPASRNSVPLTVTRTTTERIEVTGGSARIYAGQSTASYHVTSYDRFGNTADATNQTSFSVTQPVETTSGCDSPPPGNTPTCHAQSLGAHTVTARYHSGQSDQKIVTLPLWVDPSLSWSLITLSGGPGPTPRVAVGGASAPYTATITDIYGNNGVGTAVNLTISPDGTCDLDTATCTPAVADTVGVTHHTVTATSYDGLITSNSLTFTAVPAHHIQLQRGSVSIAFTRTDPYLVKAFDADEYDLGDVTAASTLSITPDGSCDDTSHTCVATVADTTTSEHTVKATYDDGTGTPLPPTAERGLIVTGPASIDLVGDPEPPRAGEATHPFIVWALDNYGNQMGLVTADAPLSISPDGTCDNAAHTCTATVPGAHTITATYPPGITDSFDIEVSSSPFVDHIELREGSASIVAGESTASYRVVGIDAYGNDNGDLTFVSGLTIGPSEAGASCDFIVAHTCTATRADSGGSHHTVEAYVAGPGAGYTATADLTVDPAPVVRLVLSGGNDTVRALTPTNPYVVNGRDVYDNDTGDLTADSILSIAPDGACEDVDHTCTATVKDFYDDSAHNSRHTITATYEDATGTATGTSTVFVHPNDPPFGVSAPSLDDMTYLINKGSFNLVWGRAADPEGQPVTYTLQHKSTAPGSDWEEIDSRIPCVGLGGFACHYTFGGTNPQEAVGTWSYRLLATDGATEVTGGAWWFDVTVDRTAPSTTDDVSGACSFNATVVTLTPDDGSGSGVEATYWEIGSNPADPTTTSNQYFGPLTLSDGQKIKYFSVDYAGNAGPIQTSKPACLDYTPPETTDNFTSDWQTQPLQVTLEATDDRPDGVAATYYEKGTNPPWPTTSSPVYDPNNKPVLDNGEWIKYFSVDKAGNEEQTKFTSDVAHVDGEAPFTSSDVPMLTQFDSMEVTLAPSDNYPGSGVDPACGGYTKYVIVQPGAEYDTANFALDAQEYDPSSKPVLPNENWTILYRSLDCAGNLEDLRSAPIRLDQAITFTSMPPVGARVGDTYAPAATADSGLPPGLPVTFAGTGAWSGSATIAMTHAGTCTVTATQPGDGFTNAAPPETQSFSVAKAPQTISFTSTAPTNAKVGDQYKPTASGGGSPHPVTFAATGFCSYDSSTGFVTLDQAGRCTVTADQAGNADFDAAPQVKQVFGASKRSQAITWSSSAPGIALVGNTYTPAATASSGLAVSLGASGGNCSYNGATGVVTMNQVGPCTITADQAGNGVYAAAPQKKQTITIAAPADAPASFQATGGVRSIALTWGPPTNSGGQPVVSYLLTATAGTTVITRSLSTTSVCPATCSYTLTGLPNGTSYDLTLAGRTAVGTGSPANASATTFALPLPLQNFAAGAGDGQAALSWTAPSLHGDTPILSYQLKVYISGALQTTIAIDPSSCSAGSCSYTLSALTNGTRYALELRAANAVGLGALAKAVVMPLALAGAPTSFQASGGVRSIALTWAPPANSGGVPVATYQLTATVGSTVITKSVAATTFCPATCSYTLTGLLNATNYALTLAAKTAAGTGPAVNGSATTFGLPTAVQSLAANAGNGQIALSWTAPSSDGGTPITGYRLRITANGVVLNTIDLAPSSCTAGSCSYTLSSLTNGTRYALRLNAVNAVGVGPATDVSATPHA